MARYLDRLRARGGAAVSGVTKLSKWTGEDFAALGIFGGVIVAVLALAILLCGKAVSAVDCEFRPDTKRCTLLHQRDRRGADVGPFW